MAKATSHSVQNQSTTSQAPTAEERRAVGLALDARWQRNRQRVGALRALAADLEKHSGGDRLDHDCIAAVVGVLLHGTEAELSRDDLRYLAAIGVAPELVRGDTRHGRADA